MKPAEFRRLKDHLKDYAQLYPLEYQEDWGMALADLHLIGAYEQFGDFLLAMTAAQIEMRERHSWN